MNTASEAILAVQERFEAQESNVRLSVLVESGLIRSAAQTGAAEGFEKQALEATCRAMVDVPVQESADHAAICAMGELRSQLPPRAGIITPANAHPALGLAQRLTRLINKAYIERHGPPKDWNFFDRPFSAAWLQQERVQKMKTLNDALARFLSDAGLKEGDLKIVDIDRYQRVSILFGEGLEISKKPKLLFDLEHMMRNETGERIELFVVEMKDLNRIRRL